MQETTGNDIIAHIINETNSEINSLLQRAISARLDQLISTGFTSDLAFSVVIMAMSSTVRENLSNNIHSLNSIISDIELNPSSAATTSYTNNSLGALSSLDSEGVSSLLSGVYWNDSHSTLTYSFNETIPDSYYNMDLTDNFTPLAQAQQESVRSIMQEVSSLLDINFEETNDEGIIRFSIIDMEESTAAFAYYPNESEDYGGDIFLSTENFGENAPIEKGDFNYSTIVHELGHALGLKHPFEGEDRLPQDEDNIQHTIMSYSNDASMTTEFFFDSEGALNYQTVFVQPSLYSLYDISALQAVYGINSNYHQGDNTYAYSFDDPCYVAIWDTGGVDTIDLSSNHGQTIFDLHSGTINSVDFYTIEAIIERQQEIIDYEYFNSWIDTSIQDIYDQGTLYTGKNNISIANGTIIENISTGYGDDIITDNEVDNIIQTGFGNDVIHLGNGGYDEVDGQNGSDIVYFNFSSNDATIETNTDGVFISTETYSAKLINIEQIGFIDTNELINL